LDVTSKMCKNMQHWHINFNPSANVSKIAGTLIFWAQNRNYFRRHPWLDNDKTHIPWIRLGMLSISTTQRTQNNIANVNYSP